MKKIHILLYVFVMILLTFQVSAEDIYKKDTCVNLIEVCNNCTYVNISSVVDPNTNFYTFNTGMANRSNIFYYNFCNTSLVGNYRFIGLKEINSIVTSFDNTFTITKTGDNLLIGNNYIFIWIIFIFACLGIFYTFFLTLAKLVTASETIYGILMDWAFIILTLLVIHLSQNIVDTFIFDISNFILSVTIWSNGLLPLISLIMTMIIKSFQKKKPIDVKELGGFR